MVFLAPRDDDENAKIMHRRALLLLHPYQLSTSTPDDDDAAFLVKNDIQKRPLNFQRKVWLRKVDKKITLEEFTSMEVNSADEGLVAVQSVEKEGDQS